MDFFLEFLANVFIAKQAPVKSTHIAPSRAGHVAVLEALYRIGGGKWREFNKQSEIVNGIFCCWH